MTIQLHLIILAIITAALGITTLAAHLRFRYSWPLRKGKRDPKWTYLNYEKDSLPSWWVRNFGLIFTSLIALGFIGSLAPFHPSYWVLTQHSGTVESVSNRFVDGTGDVSGTTYTLTLEGDPTPRVVTDSRILGIETGDRVDMTCSLEWVYGGADKSNCYLRSF